MPTEAKVGMVVGIALVIAVGIAFFGKEVRPQPRHDVQPAAVSSHDAPAAPEK